MSPEKKQLENEARDRYEQYLEDCKKWAEDEKKRKLERDERPIGEMKYGDLTRLIQAEIYRESTNGDLPFLTATQKNKAIKSVWIFVGIIIVSFVGYRMFWWTSDYSLEIDKEHLYLHRTVDGTAKTYEVVSKTNAWNLCEVGRSCGALVTPLEARYNAYYKFVFIADGRVYWVRNDMVDARAVRFVDGSWSHETDDSDDPWTSFDSYWDNSDLDRDPPY